MEKKFLAFGQEIKADSETGVISGYASVFGNVDSYGDIVEPTAFDATLKERGLPAMLWQHNQDCPIGVWTACKPDTKGLAITGNLLADDVEKAKEAYALLKAGAIKGLSIGYRTIKSFYDERGLRHLSEVELLEVSLVTFPANDKANITNVKSELPRTEREFENFLRDAGYSREQSKAIVAKGFRAVKAGHRDDDVGDDVINGLKQAIRILSGDKSDER